MYREIDVMNRYVTFQVGGSLSLGLLEFIKIMFARSGSES